MRGTYRARVATRRVSPIVSPTTLSGGETFLASLALALGLVELMGRAGGQLRALFLDEGFGSLDPNALDEALDALETRARTGQLIAIITATDILARTWAAVGTHTDTPPSDLVTLPAVKVKYLPEPGVDEAGCLLAAMRSKPGDPATTQFLIVKAAHAPVWAEQDQRVGTQQRPCS
jgi:hypothetical protein